MPVGLICDGTHVRKILPAAFAAERRWRTIGAWAWSKCRYPGFSNCIGRIRLFKSLDFNTR